MTLTTEQRLDQLETALAGIEEDKLTLSFRVQDIRYSIRELRKDLEVKA